MDIFRATIAGYFSLFKVYLTLFLRKKISRSNSVKKLLIVAESLPPFVTAGAFRPLSWLRYADENNWEAYAFSLGEEAGFSRSDYLSSHVGEKNKQFYVSPNHPKMSWKLFPNVDGGLLTAVNYFRTAVEEIKNDPPHVVVSTGPSFCNLVAGYWISRYFSVPLIIDFRDEWSFCPRSFVEHYPFDTYWEKKVIGACKQALVATPIMQEAYAKLYPQFEDKFHTLTNGIELEDIESNALPKPSGDKDSLLIRHVGTIGAWTDPTLLVNQINSIKDQLDFNIRIEFIGGADARIAEKLEREKLVDLAFLGKVDKNVAHDYMETSDVLLQLSPEGSETAYPLKLFDYMHTTNPILIFGIKYRFADIVLQNDAGFFVHTDDKSQLKEALISAYNKKTNPSNDVNEKRVDWVNKHTRKNLAKTFYGHVNGVLENA